MKSFKYQIFRMGRTLRRGTVIKPVLLFSAVVVSILVSHSTNSVSTWRLMLDRGYVVSSVAAITSVQAEEIPSFGKTLAQMDFWWNNLSPTNSKIVASTTGHNIF